MAENFVSILARIRRDFPLNHTDLLDDELKNAPELPSGCFLNDTHRRQPGDFVR
jgi:hypothetical protein